MKPCNNCPFRADTKPFPLGRDRRQQIADALLNDAAFGCHKTTSFDEDGIYKWTEKESPCVGAARLIENELGDVAANVAFRMAIAFKKFDRNEIDYSVPTLDTVEAFVSAEDCE